MSNQEYKKPEMQNKITENSLSEQQNSLIENQVNNQDKNENKEIECIKQNDQSNFDQINKEEEQNLNIEKKLNEIQNNDREALLRAKAEIENMRRRTEHEIEKAHKFALEKFINELLPVIDSLDRAVEIAEKVNVNSDMKAMVEGIELTLKSMHYVLSKFGVKVIKENNILLDPNIHQAIAMIESENIPVGYIIDVIQKGYTLNGRTIRAAIVTVAKAKEVI